MYFLLRHILFLPAFCVLYYPLISLIFLGDIWYWPSVHVLVNCSASAFPSLIGVDVYTAM